MATVVVDKAEHIERAAACAANHSQPPETTSRIDLARQLAHAATAQVYQAVFDAVLKDGEAPCYTRLLLDFTGNSNALVPQGQTQSKLQLR